MKRRSFLKAATATVALPFAGNLAFLTRLPAVSAAEAAMKPDYVRFHPDIEPLVRLLEESPRERLLEEIGHRIRQGLSYRELLTALQLAGVRNIQPRPVGFKFHAVLVVNSAHLASLAAADSERWLPILWAVDQFKSSQAADVREGDWTLGKVEESKVPPSHKAREAFIAAMDNWDEAGADAAMVGLTRTAGAHEIFQIVARYGARDFREIGHKEIYVANSFRTLEAIGWQHAEPILRSLAYALLDRDGARDNPSKSDYAADRPFRYNLREVEKIKDGWLDGRFDESATTTMLNTMREASPNEASSTAIELLNRGVSPQSLFDAFFLRSSELMMRVPGILSLHASTFTNATHYAFQHCADEPTRKMLLLQNASFLPLFRGDMKNQGVKIDELDPIELKKPGAAVVEEIFTTMNDNRLEASRKMLGFLQNTGDAKAIAAAARKLIFLKGRDSHDYKYSSAVLEDYSNMSPPHRDRFLAGSAFYLKSSGGNETDLVKRIRAALG